MGSISSKIIVARLNLLSLTSARITPDLPVQYCLFGLGIKREAMSVRWRRELSSRKAEYFVMAPQADPAPFGASPS